MNTHIAKQTPPYNHPPSLPVSKSELPTCTRPHRIVSLPCGFCAISIQLSSASTTKQATMVDIDSKLT